MSGQEKVPLYLGHLFLGQCLEDRQDLNGAVDQYKAALSQRPDSQIGAVALAHVLFLKGDAEGARATLESGVAYAGRRPFVDPFWVYLTGAPDAPFLEAFRLEAVP
jgi:predicted Zn-dependent protease